MRLEMTKGELAGLLLLVFCWAVGLATIIECADWIVMWLNNLK